MSLSNQDVSLISDAGFLLAKVEVMSKINSLMEDTRSSIKAQITTSDFVFPVDLNLNSGKISKGEYYRNLPYFVLDYPALFRKHDILAFRTMFWWGNFFSATLHLQGSHLEERRQTLIKNIHSLLDRQLYICVGDTPWEYQYEPDNYQLLNVEHTQHIRSSQFLKLSAKTPLTEWKTLPKFSSDTLSLFLSVLQEPIDHQ